MKILINGDAGVGKTSIL